LGVNFNAALTGLKANLGSFLAGAAGTVDCVFDSGEGSVAVVIDDADAISFRGGAGGGCSVSGRFVSRREEDG